MAGAAFALLGGTVAAPAAGAQDLSSALFAQFSQATESASAAQEPGPRIEVSQIVLDEEGEHEVTVTGSGFTDDSVVGTRPPLAGENVGVYVVLGKFAEEWKPSAGVPSSARTIISTKWAVPAESMETIGGPEKGAIELLPNGTFTATITVSKALVDEVAGTAAGNLGIYTYPGGGAKHAPWELYQPITFGEPAAEASGSLGSLTGLLPF
ncbi:hypothetical protein A6035_04140 [Dietzia lutea]|uniref:Htaa domain-containing protein n=1 Tax=Dietzia lutea TaxID=546160 RepID=A0A2S1R5F5_9ACTN|nr:hypothetical protein A6035_04140 [Dietzia lutea]